MKSESGFSLAIASQPLPTSLIQWNTTEILNVMNLTIMLVLLTLTGGSKISFDTKSILRSLLLERLLETSKGISFWSSSENYNRILYLMWKASMIEFGASCNMSARGDSLILWAPPNSFQEAEKYKTKVIHRWYLSGPSRAWVMENFPCPTEPNFRT